MNIQKIIPESREHWLAMRREHITSTDVAALFDLSPYFSYYELWHRKHRGASDELDDNERMLRGRQLEGTIAHMWSEQCNLPVVKASEYLHDDELRVGCSLDYLIVGGGILECKNVDSLAYAKTWTDTEAPPHIELQVQFQLLLSGASRAHIAALVGGNKLVTLTRMPDLELHARILEEVRKFWAQTEEPQPDIERDAGFLISTLQHAEPGKEIAPTGELNQLVMIYLGLSKQIKADQNEQEQVKAEILLRLGDAEKCRSDEWTISAGLVGPAEISYTRKPYRAFKVTKRGEK